MFLFFFEVFVDLVSETAKYVFPKRFDGRNLEEALMAGSLYNSLLNFEWLNVECFFLFVSFK